jgi:hypothetical protein
LGFDPTETCGLVEQDMGVEHSPVAMEEHEKGETGCCPGGLNNVKP